LIQIPEILFHLQILILRHFRQTQRIILIWTVLKLLILIIKQFLILTFEFTKSFPNYSSECFSHWQ
jgi:hypothetical protein